jgi:protein-S-isoprenylcysteine O-methyltransferase Ste14
MGLDIRWPIGLMFSLIGVMLTLYGLFTGSNAELYKRSLDINVNLYWGMLLLVFGGAMLITAWRGSKAPPAGTETGSGPGTR